MSSATPVPVFKLYGETLHWPTPDLLHMESIPERSQLHDWHIQPHQHADLVQLLYVRQGQVELEIEGQQSCFSQPVIQVTPALCVHGFRFSRNVDGYVLSLALPLVEELGRLLGGRVFSTASAHLLTIPERQYLDNVLDQLWQEYNALNEGRDVMLSASIHVLLIWLHRLQRKDTAQTAPHDRGEQHLSAFLQLLEQHYREHWSIDSYATRLGVSAPHLNALCRRLCHQSALQIISQRLLLEAKRCLIYTSMTVSQVADNLGFSEPAYFSRFFKRYTGMPPRQFRMHSGQETHQ
ncbi:helix-turn-helix domain-containing protein [Halopseudomonas sp. Lyrl_26]|uniref:helix-turn-helix domain-containing protein n=1 Tax=Halopseudomonas sp. Lyrl_26 TaxID=3110923 RepID=UPI003F81BA3C